MAKRVWHPAELLSRLPAWQHVRHHQIEPSQLVHLIGEVHRALS